MINRPFPRVSSLCSVETRRVPAVIPLSRPPLPPPVPFYFVPCRSHVRKTSGCSLWPPHRRREIQLRPRLLFTRVPHAATRALRLSSQTCATFRNFGAVSTRSKGSPSPIEIGPRTYVFAPEAMLTALLVNC